MGYDLELLRVAKEIAKNKAKRVMIQLPDGLKPEAGRIAKELSSRTGAEIFIWAGSCYGACDTPQGLDLLKIDMLVQFGHSEWR